MIRNRFGPKPYKNGTDGHRRIFKREELNAVEHLAKLGATNTQMAEFFGVYETTIQDWKRNHPKFAKAFRKGGIVADLKVTESLFRRATGYEYIEEEYSVIEIDGIKKSIDEMVQVKRIKKVLPPDVKAGMHWLKVRQREVWSPAAEIVNHHSGRVNVLHAKLEDINVQALTPEARKMLFEVAQNQLIVSANNQP